MNWLNYHHLLYFWTVARAGTIAKAAQELRLGASAVSTQVKQLERDVGQPLFERDGRRLSPTPMGRTVLRYADEIFRTGNELKAAIATGSPSEPLLFRAGVVDAVPKSIAARLLRPALAAAPRVRLLCREGERRPLLGALALHELDVVISDGPADEAGSLKVFNHMLGASGLSFLAPKSLARGRGRFPQCLQGLPMLAPWHDSSTRRVLDQWLARKGIRPVIVAEFEDSALQDSFGVRGLGVFPAPTAIEAELKRQYGLRVLGRTEEVEVAFYAVSADRRLRHPAVAALVERARAELFG